MHYYLGREEKTYGPYSENELRTWCEEGRISPDDLCCPVGGGDWVRVSRLFGLKEIGTEKSFVDLKPHLLSPLGEFWSFNWIKDWKTLSIVLLGLFPLVSTHVIFAGDHKAQYWSIALYFSALWAFFFNSLVKPEGALTKNIFICFFGTGIVSMPIMLGFYEIGFFGEMAAQSDSNEFVSRYIGMFFGVAILEEACKLFVLIIVWKWFQKDRCSIQTFMFYGLMSGLGFGIYEGVAYQTGANLSWIPDTEEVSGNSETLRELTHQTYIANVWRLTTLPFLHAIWCAIAGMFFGLSTVYGYRWLLIGTGLVVPALLHAGHNSLNDFMDGWGIALVDILSVVVLMVYWREQQAIEKTLRS